MQVNTRRNHFLPIKSEKILLAIERAGGMRTLMTPVVIHMEGYSVIHAIKHVLYQTGNWLNKWRKHP
jgi:hypothetical protein